jgi:hypothetical protein
MCGWHCALAVGGWQTNSGRSGAQRRVGNGVTGTAQPAWRGISTLAAATPRLITGFFFWLRNDTFFFLDGYFTQPL